MDRPGEDPPVPFQNRKYQMKRDHAMAGNAGALPIAGRRRWPGWLLSALLLWPLPVQAHDFWIEPQSFRTEPGHEVTAMIWVGDHGTRERSSIAARRIISLRSLGPGGLRDQLPRLALGGNGADMRLSFAEHGTYLLVLETDHAPIALPADQFNAYLRQEGLTPAIVWRHDRGQEERPGREIYCRRAKTILQVGPVEPASTGIVTQAAGLNLEIVPETHPGLLTPGQTLPVRVLFDGAVLAGAQVRLSDLTAQTQAIEQQVTDQHGRARFTIPRQGRWLLSVVWTKPVPDGIIADFETRFASLSFGTGDEGSEK